MPGSAVRLPFATALLCAAGGLHAQPASAPSGTAAGTIAPRLNLRLNPPLGRPLAYRLVNEKITKAATENAVFDQDVTFTRLGEGYAMRIRLLRVSKDGKTRDLTQGTAGLPASVRVLLMPMTIELDREGRPLRLHDWAGYGKALVGVAPDMAAEAEPDPAKRPAAEQYFRTLLQKRVAMSAEAAVGALVQGWPPILAELGGEIVPDHDATALRLLPSPFAPGALEHRTTTRWHVDAAAGTLNLTRRTEPTAEAMPAAREGVAAVIRQGTPEGSAVDEAAVKRALAVLKAVLTTRIAFDRETGLVRSAVIEKVLTLPEGEVTERVTLTAQ